MILCAIAAVVLSACAKEIESEKTEDIRNLETVTFEAAASTQTKTTLVDGTKVYWCAGDQIAVKGALNPFSNPLGKDETAAVTSFTGDVEPADEYYAVYPYVDSWEGSIAYTSLPVIQLAEKGSFGSGYNITAAKTTSEDMSFSFKNVVGHLKFTNNLPAGYLKNIIVSTNTGEMISGNIQIDCAAETPEAESLDGRGYLMNVFDGDHTAGDYYIAMVPGEYPQGITIDFIGSDGYMATVYTDQALTLEAGHIYPIGSTDNLEWYDPAEDSEYSVWKGKFVTGNTGLYGCDVLAGWAFDWSEVTAGDILKIHGGTADHTLDNWYLSLVTTAEWKPVAGLPEKYESAESVEIRLTKQVLDDILANGGIFITGMDYCFTNIEIIPGPDPIVPGEDETVIWESWFDSGKWNGGNQDLAWGKYDWSQHNPGDILKIYGGPTDPSLDVYTLSLRVAADWSKFLTGVPQYINNVETYTVTMTQEMIDDLVANNGLIIQGDNYTMRMITVKAGEESADGTKTVVLWEGSTNLGDWDASIEMHGIGKLPYGAELHVEYETPAEVGEGWYQIKISYIDQDWNWHTMESTLPDANEWESVMLEPGTSHYSVTLTDNDVDAVNAGKGIVIQGYAATIKKVYYTIEGEDTPAELVIWEGSFDNTGWSGNQDLAWGGYNWSSVTPGQILTIYGSPVDPTAGWWCISLRVGDSWGNLAGVPAQYDNPSAFTEVELSQETIDHLVSANGLVLTGTGYIITKITLK